MSSLKTHMVGAALVLAALSLLTGTAFGRAKRSGCEGVLKRAPTGTAAEAAAAAGDWDTRAGGWKVRRWPDPRSPVIMTVRPEASVWLYLDYEGPTYLVSVCAREAGVASAKCTREDNVDDKPSNDPKVGFMGKNAVYYHKEPCFKHADLSFFHRQATKPFKAGEVYVVRSHELYLRSVEGDNGANHPYGLLRDDDRFVKDRMSHDGRWMYGWAVAANKGINPKRRYGKVLSQYLDPEKKKKKK